MFRNPFLNESRFSDTKVDLKDFSHLPTPDQEWWDNLERKTKRDPSSDTLFEDVSAPVEMLNFKELKEGDGRNEALFDRLRFWAYDEARQGTYDEFELMQKALILNNNFGQPMDGKEVNGIVSSIDRYMDIKYVRRFYMENTTPEERIEKAKENGRKGGAVSAKVKQNEAEARINATIKQMQNNDIKITVGEVARRASSTRPTVRAYFNNHQWEQISLKEGWKQKSITLPEPKGLA